MKAVTVSDYMTRQLVTFKPETTLFEAMNVMLEKRISGAPVVDEAGAILGIISEIDFLDAMLKAAYYGQLESAVGDFMIYDAAQHIDTSSTYSKHP
jgi:Predicted transcriptional regulator, contains C-terminal CBS domains